MAGSAVVTAAAHEQSFVSGRGADMRVAASDLLSDPAAGSALGVPEVRLVSPGWEDIGLGAITDIVQHAFGPVDLDRSTVELAAVAGSRSGCPACGGRRFGFPGELAEARAVMCPAHRGQAEAVIGTRLARAGLAEQARARVESNLARWPADFWIRVHAGDALAVLDDLDGAAAHFDAALTMAEESDDFEARADAVERLRQIDQHRPNRQRRAPTGRPRRQAGRRGASRRKRKR